MGSLESHLPGLYLLFTTLPVGAQLDTDQKGTEALSFLILSSPFAALKLVAVAQAAV